MKYNLDTNQILMLAQGEAVEVNGQRVQLTVVEEVTNQLPVKSLKYDDCAERVKPDWYVTSVGNINEFNGQSDKNNVSTKRNAKQVLAFCQLLTIMHDANGREWRPQMDKTIYTVTYLGNLNKWLHIELWHSIVPYPIYFKSKELAEQAFKDNEQIFLDFFGIEEE